MDKVLVRSTWLYQEEYKIDRKHVAMGLKRRGYVAPSAPGPTASAWPARRVTGSAFPGAQPKRQRGSRRSRRERVEGLDFDAVMVV